MPPGEGDFWIERSEFNSIADYCRALVELCDEDSNFEITFSFHPRLLPADLERLAAAGILSDAESVVKLIPSYDVLVGSFSSVARWGLVSRRPTIDFDLFGFGLPRFRDCAGYLYCKKFDEVKTLLFKLRNDDEFFRQVSLGCASVADGFDKLDGSAARKLANSIKALTNPAINK